MSTSSNAAKAAAGSAILLASLSPAWAHKGQHHSPPADGTAASEAVQKAEREVNDDFKASIKPIFEAKCFSCHASGQALPWYSSLPIASGVIRQDLSEAKEHLEMASGFPFGGHGSDLEDLQAIRDSISDGDMPPLRYRLVHWRSILSSEEKSAILGWIARSESRLAAQKTGH